MTHALPITSEHAGTSAAPLPDIDAAAAELRWGELSDEALDEEIAAYRQGIQDVSKQLQDLGVVVSLGEHDGGSDGGEQEGKEVSWQCHTSR